MAGKLSLSWSEHPNSFVEFLQTLANGNSLVDCTLAAEGKYMRAHKVVLSACSPYFQLLFNQEIDKNPIVILKDVPYQCLKWIIDFMYLGEVQLHETQLNTFLDVAKSLQIKGLDSTDKEEIPRRQHFTDSNTKVSAAQSMECDNADELTDAADECKFVRMMDRTAKASTPEPFRGTSPPPVKGARESAYGLTTNTVAAPGIDDSANSEAHEWSLCSAPPSVVSSAPDSADSGQETNPLKYDRDENCLLQENDLTELEPEILKHGALCEHKARKAPAKTSRRRGGGARRRAAPPEVEEASDSGHRTASPAPVDKPTVFFCPFCPKQFARPHDFVVHKRRHTGERPFRCPECYKCFVQASDLTRHVHTHTGERRFACDVCGKRFNRSEALKIHARLHTGERPYECPHCDKTFAAHSQLWAHKRVHGPGRYSCDACGCSFKRKPQLAQHWVLAHAPRARVAVAKLKLESV